MLGREGNSKNGSAEAGLEAGGQGGKRASCRKGGTEAGVQGGGRASFPVVTARGGWRPRGIMAEGKTLIRVITGSKLVPFSAHHFTLKSMLF